GDALAATPPLAWAAALDLIAGGDAGRVLVLSAGVDGGLGLVSFRAPGEPQPAIARPHPPRVPGRPLPPLPDSLGARVDTERGRQLGEGSPGGEAAALSSPPDRAGRAAPPSPGRGDTEAGFRSISGQERGAARPRLYPGGEDPVITGVGVVSAFGIGAPIFFD